MASEGRRADPMHAAAWTRWRLVALIAGVAALAYPALILLNLALARPTGLASNPERQALLSVITVLPIGVTFFLAMFLALQCEALIAARARRAHRDDRLARLDAELALLAAPSGCPAPRGGYRDPVHLLTPQALLAGDDLAPGRDDALVAALFGLQAAVGRYNDLVLTAALLLADGRDGPLAAAATDYRQELAGAAAQVRDLLAAER